MITIVNSTLQIYNMGPYKSKTVKQYHANDNPWRWEPNKSDSRDLLETDKYIKDSQSVLSVDDRTELRCRATNEEGRLTALGHFQDTPPTDCSQ